VFVLLSTVMMTLDHRYQHLETFKQALGVLVYPIQFLVNLPWRTAEWVAEGVTTRQQLQEENANLRAEQLLLKGQLQKLAALQAENMRLRQLLDSSKKIGERVLIAEIMAVDMDPFSQKIVINKGSRHGIAPGQPLMDAQGIVGQVVSVNPLTSTAMIITDPSHAIPVTINRNGLRAIAYGTGTANRLDVPNLPNNADVKVGDLFVTSGLGGRFPSGYPVARVVLADLNPSRPFARVIAEPTADLERAREVLVVWPGRLTDSQPPPTEDTAEQVEPGDPAATAADPTPPPQGDPSRRSTEASRR